MAPMQASRMKKGSSRDRRAYRRGSSTPDLPRREEARQERRRLLPNEVERVLVEANSDHVGWISTRPERDSDKKERGPRRCSPTRLARGAAHTPRAPGEDPSRIVVSWLRSIQPAATGSIDNQGRAHAPGRPRSNIGSGRPWSFALASAWYLVGGSSLAMLARVAELSPPRFVATGAELSDWIERCANSDRIAIDTESDSFHHYREKVCLIQMTANGDDAIIDPLAVRKLEPLGKLLADPKKTKIFHDALYDLICLRRDFGFEATGLFDTMVSTRLLGCRSFGLASILRQRFGHEANKTLQRSDWTRRPLSPGAGLLRALRHALPAGACRSARRRARRGWPARVGERGVHAFARVGGAHLAAHRRAGSLRVLADPRDSPPAAGGARPRARHLSCARADRRATRPSSFQGVRRSSAHRPGALAALHAQRAHAATRLAAARHRSLRPRASSRRWRRPSRSRSARRPECGHVVAPVVSRSAGARPLRGAARAAAAKGRRARPRARGGALQRVARGAGAGAAARAWRRSRASPSFGVGVAQSSCSPSAICCLAAASCRSDYPTIVDVDVDALFGAALRQTANRAHPKSHASQRPSARV